MIIIKLSGGIGNNMFQYSSAKSVAIKKNLSFVYFNNKDLRYFKLKLIRFVREKVFKKKEIFNKQISENDLSKYFYLEENILKKFFYRALWIFKSKRKKFFFNQKRTYEDFLKTKKTIDLDVYKCEPWTKLEGSFSSEKYFLNRKIILKWFTLRKKYEKVLDNIISQFDEPINLRCCVHVRRGDALYMDKGFNYLGLGWSLPIQYYKYVFKKIPKNVLFIFVSDDPDWVNKTFDFIKNKVILRNNLEIIDMFIFTKCKYNIIARSTFSWWGAWLNQYPNKEVYAPKFFIGAPKNICFPLGLDEGKEVSKWNYINLKSISK